MATTVTFPAVRVAWAAGGRHSVCPRGLGFCVHVQVLRSLHLHCITLFKYWWRYELRPTCTRHYAAPACQTGRPRGGANNSDSSIVTFTYMHATNVERMESKLALHCTDSCARSIASLWREPLNGDGQEKKYRRRVPKVQRESRNLQIKSHFIDSVRIEGLSRAEMR